MSEMIYGVVSDISPIKGADFIVEAKVFGESVVVNKDTSVGDKGLFVPCDTQLSPHFCYNNNLYSNKELNKDVEAKGYIGRNRRVTAIKLKSVKSSGLFLPTSCLSYLSSKPFDKLSEAKIGYSFDTVFDAKVCQKYISEKTRNAMKSGKSKAPKVSAKAPNFAEHVDTSQIFRNIFKTDEGWVCSIEKGSKVYFHNKVHGTSARMARTLVKRPIVNTNLKLKINKLLDSIKFSRKFRFPNYKRDSKGGILYTESVENIYGTRRVAKIDNGSTGFHGSEHFRELWLLAVEGYLETVSRLFNTEEVTIYGEIAGYANGKPIMGSHSAEKSGNKKYVKKYGGEIVYYYGCDEPNNHVGYYLTDSAGSVSRFHVYRVTVDGKDLTQEQIDSYFQEELLPIDVAPPIVYDRNAEELYNLVMSLTENEKGIGADPIDGSHPSEGIVLRVEPPEGGTPRFIKSKSHAFKMMEGIAKETQVDTEDAN